MKSAYGLPARLPDFRCVCSRAGEERPDKTAGPERCEENLYPAEKQSDKAAGDDFVV